MDPAVIVALIAAIGGPLVAYIIASRRMSGKIATSDASDLWKEAGAIRNDYKSRLETAVARIAEVEGRMARMEQANNQLLDENRRCQDKIRELEEVIHTMKGRP